MLRKWRIISIKLATSNASYSCGRSTKYILSNTLTPHSQSWIVHIGFGKAYVSLHRYSADTNCLLYPVIQYVIELISF